MKKPIIIAFFLITICNLCRTQETVFQMPFIDSSNWEFNYELFPPMNESEPAEAYTEIVNNTLHMYCYQGTGMAHSWNNYKTLNNFLSPTINYQLKISFTKSQTELGSFTYSLNDFKITIPYQYNNDLFELNGLDMIIQVKDSVRVFKQLPTGNTRLDFTAERIAPSDSFKLEFFLVATGPGDNYHLVEAVIDTIEIATLPYQSIFGNESTSWNVMHEIPDGILTDSLYVKGDTVINQTTYKVINGIGDECFLRETGDHAIVYKYDASEDTEYKIMDLTLQPADTFLIGPSFNDTLIVDSIFFQDDLKHIRFNHEIDIHDVTEKIEFMEGTGSNFGFPLMSDLFTLRSRYMLCSYKDGIQTYSNTAYDGQCNVFWTGIDKSELNPRMQVYPNPAKDLLTIVFPGMNESPWMVRIYNSSGVLLKVVDHLSGPVEISNLPGGLYFLSAHGKNEILKGSFVISR
jgi:hypothetical protein